MKKNVLDEDDERAWSYLWDESAAAALYRSGRLWLHLGKRMPTDEKLPKSIRNRLQRRFLTPKLSKLWSEPQGTHRARTRHAMRALFSHGSQRVPAFATPCVHSPH
jgi:hypothetical protein